MPLETPADAPPTGRSMHHVEAVSGMAAGMSQVVVGHPFDTVKVQLQTGRYSSIARCVKEMRFSLYRGVASPLVGIGLCNSVLFHTYSLARSSYFATGSLRDVACSGAVAGAVMGMVNCPVELLKVRMQTSAAYKGIFDSVVTIVRLDGPCGLFRGLSITVLRDVPSFAAYFAVYEGLKQQLAHDRHPAWVPVVAGACAGVAAWLPCYPQDVIKSVIQSQGVEQRSTIMQTVRQIYNQRGLAGFFSGSTPTMARAIPANAATFAAFETVKSLLSPQ